MLIVNQRAQGSIQVCLVQLEDCCISQVLFCLVSSEVEGQGTSFQQAFLSSCYSKIFIFIPETPEGTVIAVGCVVFPCVIPSGAPSWILSSVARLLYLNPAPPTFGLSVPRA